MSLELHKLPDEVARLIQGLDVHPYLLAHLVLVHDSATRLVNALRNGWPNLSFDEQLVLFGAATHDIGKVRHPEEMTGPGNRHHETGVRLLEAEGIERERARFALSHGVWEELEALPVEDLLVSIADVIWAGGRNQGLEKRLTARLAEYDDRELWQTFLDLDDILIQITNQAELRLFWQMQFAPDRTESE